MRPLLPAPTPGDGTVISVSIGLMF